MIIMRKCWTIGLSCTNHRCMWRWFFDARQSSWSTTLSGKRSREVPDWISWTHWFWFFADTGWYIWTFCWWCQTRARISQVVSLIYSRLLRTGWMAVKIIVGGLCHLTIPVTVLRLGSILYWCPPFERWFTSSSSSIIFGIECVETKLWTCQR